MRLFLWATVLSSGLCAAQFKGPNDPRRFKYYTLPTQGGSGPCDICTGPGGDTIWYEDRQAKRVGVLDIKTGKIRDWPIKLKYFQPYFSGRANGTNTCFLRLGKDGFIYGSSTHDWYMMKVTPSGPDMGKTEFLEPTNDNPAGVFWDFVDGWAGPTGIYTAQSQANVVLFFDYKTKEWQYPLRDVQPGSGPTGLKNGRNGTLWVSNYFSQTFSRFNLTTNKSKTYSALPSGVFPASMRTITNKFLWANAESNQKGRSGLIRFNFDNPAEFIYLPGGPSFPVQNDRDPFGNIWVSSFIDNVLAYYSQSSGKWTTINLPGPPPPPPLPPPNYRTILQSIPIHHGPLNSMWFNNINTTQLGQYILDDAA